MLKSAKRIRKAKDPKPRETPDLSTLSPKESRKAVLGLAWPVLLELLLASLFGMLDMIMLGQLPDKHMSAAAVASVGITNQPLFLGFEPPSLPDISVQVDVLKFLRSSSMS